jgi:hypothetical protein
MIKRTLNEAKTIVQMKQILVNMGNYISVCERGSQCKEIARTKAYIIWENVLFDWSFLKS